MLGACQCLSWADQTEPHSLSARVAAGVDVELAENRGDVMFDRFLGHDKPRGDLRVAQTLGQQLDHFALASGETRGVLAGASTRSSGQASCAALSEPPRDDRRRRPRSQLL